MKSKRIFLTIGLCFLSISTFAQEVENESDLAEDSALITSDEMMDNSSIPLEEENLSNNENILDENSIKDSDDLNASFENTKEDTQNEPEITDETLEEEEPFYFSTTDLTKSSGSQYTVQDKDGNPLVISARLRNDFINGVDLNNEYFWADSFETRLYLDFDNDLLKVYAEGHVTLNFGLFTEIAREYPILGSDFASLTGDIDRAFIRFYSDVGEFTLGKTYVNFGNYGFFNPLDLNKEMDFSDPDALETGNLAFTWKFPITDFIGGQFFVSPGWPLEESSAGLSFEFTVGNFDIGTVYEFKETGKNVLGAYFKGDAFFGINGSYAFHFDQVLTGEDLDIWNEFSFGLDYSFFGGDLVWDAMVYFNQKGATSVEDIKALETNAESSISMLGPSLEYSNDYYFASIAYVTSSLTYAVDEFLSFGLFWMISGADASGFVMPSITYQIYNEVSITTMMNFYYGKKDGEFSPSRTGYWSWLVRLEAKI